MNLLNTLSAEPCPLCFSLLFVWPYSTVIQCLQCILYHVKSAPGHLAPTVCTALFSTKSPWSVFFRGEMAVICHKISVKCRWNHGETFTVKIYKLGPKCRWNILIVGDNTAAKIMRVCNCTSCVLLFFVAQFCFLLIRTLYFNLIPVFFSGMPAWHTFYL